MVGIARRFGISVVLALEVTRYPKTVKGILRHEDARTTMQLFEQSDQESRLDAQARFLEVLLGDKAHLLTETVQ